LATNQKIDEKFGLTHSTVIKRVREAKEMLNNDKELE
jgi:hypothetical protein